MIVLLRSSVIRAHRACLYRPI